MIADKLNWKAHIDFITKKTNKSLAFLKRNIHSGPPQTNAQCYETLVRFTTRVVTGA